jgi:hypothetical protein
MQDHDLKHGKRGDGTVTPLDLAVRACHSFLRGFSK